MKLNCNVDGLWCDASRKGDGARPKEGDIVNGVWDEGRPVTMQMFHSTSTDTVRYMRDGIEDDIQSFLCHLPFLSSFSLRVESFFFMAVGAQIRPFLSVWFAIGLPGSFSKTSFSFKFINVSQIQPNWVFFWAIMALRFAFVNTWFHSSHSGSFQSFYIIRRHSSIHFPPWFSYISILSIYNWWQWTVN